MRFRIFAPSWSLTLAPQDILNENARLELDAATAGRNLRVRTDAIEESRLLGECCEGCRRRGARM